MILKTPLFPGFDEVDQMTRIIGILGSPTVSDLKSMMPHQNKHENLLASFQMEAISMTDVFPKHFKQFFDILSKMLVFDPKKRWTTAQLLRHPLFIFD